jgi:hypothetical protein
MGWSCRADAAKVMDKMTQYCIEQTDSQNRYKDAKGNEYFWELSRTEHDDGAITGTIWKLINGGTHCKRSGSFRIEGDGSVTRMPKVLKDAVNNN